MRKFFGFERHSIPYYFKKEGTKDCIDKKILQSKLVELVMKEKFIEEFASELEKDFMQFPIWCLGLREYIATVFVKRTFRDYSPTELKKTQISCISTSI